MRIELTCWHAHWHCSSTANALLKQTHIFMQRKLHLAWCMPWFCANYTDELQHMFQLFKLHIGNCPFLFVNGGYYFVSVIFAILKDAKGTLQATKLGWTIIMRLKIFGMMKGNPLNLCEHAVNMQPNKGQQTSGEAYTIHTFKYYHYYHLLANVGCWARLRKQKWLQPQNHEKVRSVYPP